jgi:phospholipid-binding lipoprotein MlaA
MQVAICAMLREKTARIKNNNTIGEFMNTMKKPFTRFMCVSLLSSLVACTGTPVKDARDPMENWNRDVQSFNESADKHVMAPVAYAYRWAMPSFANEGVSNLFDNVSDIGVSINDLLQLKFAQGGQDTSRFLVNTVAGLGGFIDVADMIGLPKHKEDFDQTLGFWGVPNEPYVVIPFLGPSSPRGIVGRLGDSAMNPVNYVGFGVMGLSTGATATAISSGSSALKGIDTRADHLGAEKVLNEATEDRYNFVKNSYFQQRDYLVNDGSETKEDDFFDIVK